MVGGRRELGLAPERHLDKRPGAAPVRQVNGGHAHAGYCGHARRRDKAKRRETPAHDYLAGVLNFHLTILSDDAKYRLITKENDMSDRHEKRHRENPEAPVTNIVTYVPKA